MSSFLLYFILFAQNLCSAQITNKRALMRYLIKAVDHHPISIRSSFQSRGMRWNINDGFYWNGTHFVGLSQNVIPRIVDLQRTKTITTVDKC